MTIADIYMRGKQRLAGLPSYLAPVLVLVLATSASFGLGVLAGKDLALQGPSGAQAGIQIGSSTLATPLPGSSEAPQELGVYVASKNGTKYYLPSCSGAGRIKEENKVWFQTVADAVAAGYTPANACPGL
jgi:hypothetical protein